APRNETDITFVVIVALVQEGSSVAVAITPGHAATVTHERPPPAMGHQARQGHQGDVPTPCIDTQNVFLCRGPCGTERDRARRVAERTADADERASDQVLTTGVGEPGAVRSAAATVSTYQRWKRSGGQ